MVLPGKNFKSANVLAMFSAGCQSGQVLASTGVITATADLGYYCFDTRHVADAVATGVALMLGGGASAVIGVGWRFWAKRKGGVT